MKGERPNSATFDHDLDIYRGCAMIYIVGFMHIIGYWIDPKTSDLLSLTDIVMPIIFYISGASYSLSRKKSYGEYLKGRIKRIIIPLVVFMGIYISYNTIKGEIALQELPRIIAQYTHNIVVGGFEDLGQMWFITPYAIIALLLPLMWYISRRINQYGIYALLLATMVAIYFYPTFVLCYGVSTFAGLYYKQKRPYHTSIVLLMFVAAIVMWIAQGNTWNMQLNKFPTTLMYLSYTSCMLIVFGKPIKWLCRKAHEVRFVKYIIDQYAHHGYVIYLYHITVIRLIHDIYYLLCEKFALQESFVMHPLCSLTVIAITTLLAMIAVGKIIEPINNTATKIASLVWHKTQSIFTPTSH